MVGRSKIIENRRTSLMDVPLAKNLTNFDPKSWNSVTLHSAQERLLSRSVCKAEHNKIWLCLMSNSIRFSFISIFTFSGLYEIEQLNKKEQGNSSWPKIATWTDGLLRPWTMYDWEFLLMNSQCIKLQSYGRIFEKDLYLQF